MPDITSGDFWQSFEDLRTAYRAVEETRHAYREDPSKQTEAAWKGAIAKLYSAKVQFSEVERRYVTDERPED
jgi:hypothetical protein